MADRTRIGIDLGALGRALTTDLRVMTGASRRDGGRDEPFATLGKVLGEVGKRLERVGNVVETERERRDARAKLLEEGIATRRKALDRRSELRRRQVAVDDPDRLVVAGRVVDEKTGLGLPGVRLPLVPPQATTVGSGEAITDELGFFRLAVDPAALGDGAEVRLRVLDEAGKLLYESDRPLKLRPGKSVMADAAVDGGRVPTARVRSELEVARTEAEAAELGRRETELASLRTIRAGGWVKGRDRPIRASAVAPAASEVPGAGRVFVDRLRAHGIVDAAGIAAQPPERLAEILETTEARAAKILASAAEVLRAWKRGRRGPE